MLVSIWQKLKLSFAIKKQNLKRSPERRRSNWHGYVRLMPCSDGPRMQKVKCPISARRLVSIAIERAAWKAGFSYWKPISEIAIKISLLCDGRLRNFRKTRRR